LLLTIENGLFEILTLFLLLVRFSDVWRSWWGPLGSVDVGGGGAGGVRPLSRYTGDLEMWAALASASHAELPLTGVLWIEGRKGGRSAEAENPGGGGGMSSAAEALAAARE